MKNPRPPTKDRDAASALRPELVPLLLAFVGRPRTANAALDAIDAWTGAPPPPLGTFYRRLKQASDAGWLAILDPEPPERAPGRPGRRYHLTAAGEQALRAALEASRRLLALARERRLVGSAATEAQPEI